MTRYSHLRWVAPLGGLVAAGLIALSAAPAGATIVCPTGIKPPSPYCTNVLPTATTGSATKVGAKKATLNGVAGPNVSGGDITQYFFKYGKTTNYGSQTPTGTVGSCPVGISPPSPYCNVPKTQNVSANISGLAPCTSYHFQLFASNTDGSAPPAGDMTFTTAFAPPLTNVNAPTNVNAGRRFKVKFGLKYNTQRVRIVIRRGKNGPVVSSTSFGPLAPGRHSVTVRAPNRRGNYILSVIAKLSCGSQTFSQRLKVR
jgi:hypothetical protein